jgi:sigma-E factor negative regulatory protein RseA
MERISALMDGEIDHGEVAQVVRQVKDRSELKEAWSTYHLIGEAMRGERLTDSGVMQAVSASLAAEPTVLAPNRKFGESIRRLALPSMAAAAAVGTVTWVSLATYQPAATPNPVPLAEVIVPMTAMTEPAPLGSLVQAASLSSAPPQIQLPSRRIDAYLEAHQEFSPSRTIQGLASYARTVSATGGVEAGR